MVTHFKHVPNPPPKNIMAETYTDNLVNSSKINPNRVSHDNYKPAAEAKLRGEDQTRTKRSLEKTNKKSYSLIEKLVNRFTRDKSVLPAKNSKKKKNKNRKEKTRQQTKAKTVNNAKANDEEKRLAYEEDNFEEKEDILEGKEHDFSEFEAERKISDIVEQLNAVPMPETQRCRFFKAGKCKFGDKCKFSHEVEVEIIAENDIQHITQKSSDSDENKKFNDEWNDKIKDCIVMVSPWAVWGSRGTKNYQYCWYENDPNIFIEGWFNFTLDNYKQVIRYPCAGKLPVYCCTENLPIVTKSSCGTLLYVNPELIVEYKRLDDMIQPTTSFVWGTPRERLWASFKNVIAYMDCDKGYDPTIIHNKIRQNWRRFNYEYHNMGSDIVDMVASEQAYTLLDAKYSHAAEMYERRLTLKLKAFYTKTGEDWKDYYRKVYARHLLKRVVMVGGITAIAAAIPVATAIVAGVSIAAAVSTTGIAYATMPKRVDILRKMADDINVTYKILPASRIRKKKSTIHPERLDELEDCELPKGSKLKVDYDQVYPDEEISEEVDIYGATIDIPLTIPTQSSQNAHAGLLIRYLYNRDIDPEAEADYKEYAFKVIDSLDTFYISDDIDVERFLKSQYGQKRGADLFSKIDDDLNVDEITYKIFVKAETYLGKTEENQKPRIIFVSPDEYIARYGAYFNDLGKQMTKRFSVNDDKYYTSKSTPDDIGYFATRLFNEKSHVYESDVSNWDGSICSADLEIELYFLQTRVEGMPDSLEELYPTWGLTKAQTKDGTVQVSCSHGRRSGDLWTSCFNSLLNMIKTAWALGIPFEDLLGMFMGDDNAIAVDDEVDIETVTNRYWSLGAVVELIKRDSIIELGFCSGRFWPVDGVWRWGNLPFRTLAKLGVNHHKHHKKFFPGLLKGTSIGMLSTAGHVPIIGAFLRALASDDDEVKARVDNRGLNPYRIQGGIACYPSMDTYHYFCALYDMDLQSVFDLEEWIECNIKLENCPYFISDQSFIDGYWKEFPKTDGMNSENLTIDDLDSNYHYTVNVVPMEEELEKLVGVNSVIQAWMSGWRFGAEEEREYAEQGEYDDVDHRFLHAFFSVLSYIKLEWGVAAHSRYNHRAMMSARNYPCCRRRSLSESRFKPSSLEDHLPELLYPRPRNNSALSDFARRFPGLYNMQVDRPDERERPIRAQSSPSRISRLRKQSGQTSTSPHLPAKKKKAQKKKKKNNNSSGGRGWRSAIKSVAKNAAKMALTEGGAMAGGLIPIPGASSFGRKAGAWISKVSGMGDYKVSQNSLFNGQVPEFSPTNHSITVKHREYLGDIRGSVGWSSQEYVINPGLVESFPWLSKMAGLYTQYKLHGAIFEFVSTSATALNSTNTALGTVILSTRYNEYDPVFTSKIEALAHEFSTSSKPSESHIHPIECAPQETPFNVHFVRDSALRENEDARLYDWGVFQLSTVGMQAAATIGELWVSYDVIFEKPRLNPTAYPNPLHGRISNGPAADTDPLGVIQRGVGGNMGLTVTSTTSGWDTINFPPWIQAGRFLVIVSYSGSGQTVANWSLTWTNAERSTTGWGFDLDSVHFKNLTPDQILFASLVDVTGWPVSGVFTTTTLANSDAIDVQIYQVPSANQFEIRSPLSTASTLSLSSTNDRRRTKHTADEEKTADDYSSDSDDFDFEAYLAFKEHISHRSQVKPTPNSTPLDNNN